MRGSDHNCAAGCSIQPHRSHRVRLQFHPVARSQTLFVCRQCGGESLKWQGQCAHCKAWDTLERVTGRRAGAARARRSCAQVAARSARVSRPRRCRACRWGGGARSGLRRRTACRVRSRCWAASPASVNQPCCCRWPSALSRQLPIVYASGEESMAQVALRAQRLGLQGAQLELIADSSLDAILQLAAESALRVAGDRLDTVDAPGRRRSRAPDRWCSCANAPRRWCDSPRAAPAP